MGTSESDPKPNEGRKSHWRFLAEMLGAPAPAEDAEQEIESPVEDELTRDQQDAAVAKTDKDDRSARQTRKPVDRPPSDWFALASDLGVEVERPAEPEWPDETPADCGPVVEQRSLFQDDIQSETKSKDVSPEPSSMFGDSVDDKGGQLIKVEEEETFGEATTDEIFISESSEEAADESTDVKADKESESEDSESTTRPRRRRGRRRNRSVERERAEDAAGEEPSDDVPEAGTVEQAGEGIADDDNHADDNHAEPEETRVETGGSDDETEEAPRKRRSRRRRRRPRGEKRSEESEQQSADDDQGDDDQADDDQADDDQAGGEDDERESSASKRRSGSRSRSEAGDREAKHRTIPTWDEAIAVIVDLNLASRSKSDSGKAKSRGSRRRRS